MVSANNGSFRVGEAGHLGWFLNKEPKRWLRENCSGEHDGVIADIAVGFDIEPRLQ